MGKNGGNDGFVFIAIVAIIICMLVWYFVPQLFVVPVYYLRYAQAFTMTFIPFGDYSLIGDTLLSYMDKVSPFEKGYRDWVLSMAGSQSFYIYLVPSGLICILASRIHWLRTNSVMVYGRDGVDLEKTIGQLAEKDFPHIRPFVDFNPLLRDEKKGLWRMPDTMLDFSKNNDIMPMCKGCRLPLYIWDEGIVDCESHYDKRNLLQGGRDRYCRVIKPSDTAYYFRFNVAQDIFFSQLTSMGQMPSNLADLPAILLKQSPMAYLIFAMCFAKLEEIDFFSRINLNNCVSRMADSVKGFGQQTGRGVFNKKNLKEAIDFSSKHFISEELIRKYDEPLHHGYIITYLMGLLDHAHVEKGDLPTSLFSYVIGFDRPLYYALNSVGSPSPHVECWGCFYHMKAEVKLDRAITGLEARILSKQYTEKYAAAMGHDA